MDVVAILVIYLVLGLGTVLGCAFGTRAVMKNKGRSGTAGFFMGFFLGVFGLLIAALLPTTPEYEVYRMQRQMQLMNIATQGMQPGAAAGAMPIGLVAPPTRASGPVSLQPLAILCAIAGVLYAATAYQWTNQVVFRDWEYGSDSNSYRYLVMLVGVGVAVLAVRGLMLQSQTLVLSAVGLMLGAGSAGFAKVASWSGLTDTDWLLVGAADIVIVVAVCLALRGGRPVALPKQPWLAVCGALVVLTLLAVLDGGSVAFDGAQVVPGAVGVGVILVVVAAVQRTERGALIIAGWGVGLLVRLLTWRGPSYGSYDDMRALRDSTWLTLVGVVGAIMSAFVVMQLRQGATVQVDPAQATAGTGRPTITTFAPPTPPTPPTTPVFDPLRNAPPPPPPN